MKALIPALILGAVMFTAGVQAVAPTMVGKCGSTDIAACDLDNDGSISILDITIVAQFFGQHPVDYPCVPSQHFTTPEIEYNAELTPVAAVVNRVWVPTTHPLYAANLAGTPVRLVPC